MLIEQTHFPLSGPNWGNIAIGAIVLLSIGAIVYVKFKPAKIVTKPRQKKSDIL